MTADAEVASTMIVNDSAECSLCTLGPPPDMILRLPPPPIPTFLVHSSDYYPGVGASDGLPFFEHFNNSPCKHSCEWRAEGVQYVEMPQQGTVFDDTWLLVLISSCIGVIFIGIVLAALLIKCKLQADVNQSNDDASQCSNRSNKNSTLSTSTASSGMQTTTTSGVGPCVNTKSLVRLQNEAVLYPCGQQDSLQDSRVMWAKLTPRGTTRHYLEEHTYETIGNVCNGQLPLPPPPPQPPAYVSTAGMTLAAAHHKRSYSESPTEHVNLKTYTEPPAPSPIMSRPKDEKAFDNTAFVDYEEPLSMRNEYYQLEDVLEPCDPIFSVQGLYGMPIRGGGVGNGGNCVSVGGTLRPRVSSPTRIEHPNLPPLNLQPLRKHPSRKNSLNQHAADCTLLRGSMTSSAYIPTI
ncbi:uncharacterized protein LOC100679656 isoform X3 [Nasonia vitripennis]|uniref:Uncharacterized protein n=1 Tax=Nasonia vitripennis TaxID=7425 RepID=A0A7M7HDZ2_NASVI|nr:uncharacterized protein LOC100679656 isoform X3 [Nasonia vitripennis]